MNQSQTSSVASKRIVSLDSPRNASDREYFLHTDQQVLSTGSVPDRDTRTLPTSAPPPVIKSTNFTGHVSGYPRIYDFGVGNAVGSGSVTPVISNTAVDVSKDVEALQASVASNKELLCDIANVLQDGFKDIRRAVHTYQPSYMTEEARPVLIGAAMEEMFVEIKEMILQQQRQHRDDIHSIHALLLSVEKGDKQREANIKTVLVNHFKEHHDMACRLFAENEKHWKETTEEVLGKTHEQMRKLSIVSEASSQMASPTRASSRHHLPSVAKSAEEHHFQKHDIDRLHMHSALRQKVENEPVKNHHEGSGKYALKSKVQNYIAKLQMAEHQSSLASYAEEARKKTGEQVSHMKIWFLYTFLHGHFFSAHSAKILHRDNDLFNYALAAGDTACQLLVNIVESKVFTTLIVSLIVANAVWMGFVADRKVKDWVAGRDPDETDDDYKWETTISDVFTIVFAVELALRMLAYRFRFFFSKDWYFNIIDVFVVILGLLRYFDIGANLTVLRLLRLFKVFRLFRVVRVMRVFNDLRVIVSTFMGGLTIAMWSFCLSFMWCFLVAICIMETLLTHADRKDEYTQALIQKYFGSFLETLRTLYVASHGGEGWSNIERQLGDLELTSITVFISVHIVMLMNCLLPVVFAAFVLKVFDIARLDTYVALHRRTYLASQFANDLQSRLLGMGYSLEDVVTIESVDELLQTSEIELFFEAHGLETTGQEAFELFESELDGTITITQFIYGCQYVFLEGSKFDNFGVFHLSEQVVRLGQAMQGIQDRQKDMLVVVFETYAEVHKKNRAVPNSRLQRLLEHHKEDKDPGKEADKEVRSPRSSSATLQAAITSLTATNDL